jgi:hypothetical protein
MLIPEIKREPLVIRKKDADNFVHQLNQYAAELAAHPESALDVYATLAEMRRLSNLISAAAYSEVQVQYTLP